MDGMIARVRPLRTALSRVFARFAGGRGFTQVARGLSRRGLGSAVHAATVVTLAAAAFASFYLATGSSTRGLPDGASRWATGDVFTQGNMAKDVLRDGWPYATWTQSTAPNLYPDAMVTAAVVAVTGNAVLGTFLSGVAILTLMTWASMDWAKRCGVGDRWLRLGIAAAGACVVIGSVLAPDNAVHGTYVLATRPAYHTGTWAVTVLGFALATRLLAGRGGPLAWSAFVANAFAATVSDLYFGPYFGVPLAAMAAWCVLIGQTRLARAATVVGAAGAACVTGVVSARHLVNHASADGQLHLSLTRSATAASNFSSDFVANLMTFRWPEVGTVAVAGLWAVTVFVAFAGRYRGTRSRDCARRLSILLTGTLAAVIATPAFLIGTGSFTLVEAHGAYGYKHYLQAAHWGAWFAVAAAAVAVAAVAASRRRDRVGLGVGAAALVGGCCLVQAVRSGSSLDQVHAMPHAFESAFVTELEGLMTRRGWDSGLSSYVIGRRFNGLTSFRDRRVLPLDARGRFHAYVNNAAWLWPPAGSSKPTLSPDFVVVPADEAYFDRDFVVGLFGEPAEEIALPDDDRIERPVVLVYDRDGDDLMADVRSFDHEVLAGVGGRFTAKPATFHGTTAASQPVLNFGPYVPLEPGRYRFEIEPAGGQAADVAAGRWAIGFSDYEAGRWVSFAEGEIGPDGRPVVRELELTDPECSENEILVLVHRQSDLRLDVERVAVTRLPDGPGRVAGLATEVR